MFKVGVIGIGCISNSHLDAYKKLPGIAKVVALCDINISAIPSDQIDSDINYYADYREMIDKEDLDMVDICAPTNLHSQMAIYALEKGLHTLVEKPIALNIEEVKEIEAAEKQSKGRLMVAHVCRFKPQSVLLKKYIDSQELGAPTFFHAWRYSSLPEKRWNDWLLDPKRGGGTIFDFQIHDTDLALWYLGKPISYNAQKIGSVPQNCLGHYISELGFENGTKAVLEISHIMPSTFPFTSGMSMFFERGVIETSFSSEREGTFNVYTDTGKTHLTYSQIPVEHSRNPYGEEIGHFIDCIVKNKPFRINTKESGKAVETSLKLIDSLNN